MPSNSQEIVESEIGVGSVAIVREVRDPECSTLTWAELHRFSAALPGELKATKVPSGSVTTPCQDVSETLRCTANVSCGTLELPEFLIDATAETT